MSVVDLTGILGQVDANRIKREIDKHVERHDYPREPSIRLRECHIRAVARQAGHDLGQDDDSLDGITLFGWAVDVVAEPDLFPRPQRRVVFDTTHMFADQGEPLTDAQLDDFRRRQANAMHDMDGMLGRA